MKHLICALVGAAATGFAVAAASCIIEDNSVDEKYVVRTPAAGFDLVGTSYASAGAAMDVRSPTRAYSAPLTIETGARGLLIIFR